MTFSDISVVLAPKLCRFAASLYVFGFETFYGLRWTEKSDFSFLSELVKIINRRNNEDIHKMQQWKIRIHKGAATMEKSVFCAAGSLTVVLGLTELVVFGQFEAKWCWLILTGIGLAMNSLAFQTPLQRSENLTFPDRGDFCILGNLYMLTFWRCLTVSASGQGWKLPASTLLNQLIYTNVYKKIFLRDYLSQQWFKEWVIMGTRHSFSQLF